MKTRSWSGTVRVTGATLSRTTFERDGQTSHAWSGAQSVVLATSADGELEIDLGGADLKMAPEETRRGSWSSLESDPFAEPFVSQAPGPHVHVKLVRSTLRDGERVVVAGTADDSNPKRIRATVVASGDAARDVVEREEPGTRREPFRTRRPPLVFLVAGLAIAAGLATFASRIPYSPATLDLDAIALVIACFALHRYARALVVFRAGGGRVDKKPFGWIFHATFVSTYAIFAVIFAGGDWPGHLNDGKQQNASPMLLVMLAIFLLLLAIDLVRSGRHSIRLARITLTAGAGGVGKWGAVTGVVRAPAERAAVYSLLEEEWRDGSGSNPRTEIELQSKFILETADGEVQVEPRQEACWATDFESASKARARPNREKAVLERTEIREGARLVAVGRMKSERDMRILAPTGPESLLLFSSASVPPRALLAWRTGVWLACLTTLVVGVAACTALAFVQPNMPAPNMPESN